MKKVFLLATVALLSTAVAFANDGGKDKKKGGKARTEKKCPTPCPKPCPPCCDKDKCEKS
jgi:hypothetical protein